MDRKYAEDFDKGLHRLIDRVNARAGAECMSARYEGKRRWSVLGTYSAEWLQFELIDGKRFWITRVFKNRSIVCEMRRGVRSLEADINMAIRRVCLSKA